MSPVDTPNFLSDLTTSRPFAELACVSQAAYEIKPFHGSPYWGREPYVVTVPGRLASARWFRPVLNELAASVRLPRGWDTYDGAPVSTSVASGTFSFLSRILEPSSAAPAVVPLADGGVQLEWHRGGLDVEVSFSPGDARPEIYVNDLEAGIEWEGDPTSPEFDEIRPLLQRLRTPE